MGALWNFNCFHKTLVFFLKSLSIEHALILIEHIKYSCNKAQEEKYHLQFTMPKFNSTYFTKVFDKRMFWIKAHLCKSSSSPASSMIGALRYVSTMLKEQFDSIKVPSSSSCNCHNWVKLMKLCTFDRIHAHLSIYVCMHLTCWWSWCLHTSVTVCFKSLLSKKLWLLSQHTDKTFTRWMQPKKWNHVSHLHAEVPNHSHQWQDARLCRVPWISQSVPAQASLCEWLYTELSV